jgi:hypothetical protein
VFLGSFLCCAQNDNDPTEYLEKNGYKLNMKVKKKKEKHLTIFWLPSWNHEEKSGNLKKNWSKSWLLKT